MPTQTPAPPAAPAPQDRSRVASGTVFVVVCAALAVAFVLFLIFVSPVLLDRTLGLAPPPAPQVVASGEVDGRTWTATALDGNAGARVADADGIEPVLEEEPCLVVDLGDGSAPAERCALRRGGSLRDLAAAVDPSGRAIAYGIVAPEVVAVELDAVDGATLAAVPSYVDFGFPLGFFALEVDAGTTIGAVRAIDRDGVVRATATCEPGAGPVGSCAIAEGDY